MGKTNRAEFTFVVKEGAEGRPWIAAEPLSGETVFKGLVGFDLASDATLEQAKELAAYMRKHIRGMNSTRDKDKKKKKDR
jgi:hypothetical protein